MSASKRSRVSCYPCRIRKSKCDQARPCSSCVLRDTAQQCTDNPSAPTASTPSTRAKRQRIETPAASTSPTQSAAAPPLRKDHSSRAHTVHDEITQLKAGLIRLETLVSSTQTAEEDDDDDEGDIPDIGHLMGPSSARSRQRWSQVRALLPPMIDTHLMFHYAFVESDWLLEFFSHRRFIRRWSLAYRNQAISDVFAAQVLALVGCAALFLGDNSSRVLQSAIPVRSMHHSLVMEAINILQSTDEVAKSETQRLDLIESHLFISLYFRCISPDVKMARVIERTLALMIEFGLTNELHPSWIKLSSSEVDRRRLLVSHACVSARWLSFHARFLPILDTLREIRVGQPSYRTLGFHPSLSDWPCPEDIQASISNAKGAIPASWQIRTQEQMEPAKRYLPHAHALSTMLPVVSLLIVQIETKLINEANTGLATKQDFKQLAKETRACLDTLNDWRTVILPEATIGEAQIVEAHRATSFGRDAKRIVLTILLNHHVYYMTAALLRPWVLLADRTSRLREQRSLNDYDPPQITEGFFSILQQHSNEHVQMTQTEWLPVSFWREMQQRSVEVARKSISTLPLISALQAEDSSYFYVGWVAASLYEAALNLAVPLVGFHRQQAVHVKTQQPWFLDCTPNDLGHDIVAVLEALAQHSNNSMAKNTGELLHKVMLAAQVSDSTGIRLPTSRKESMAVPAAHTNATDGLSLLAAASSSNTQAPSRTPDADSSRRSGGTVSSSTTSPVNPVVSDGPAYEALATSRAEAEIVDKQFLDELLQLDSSFWESVLHQRSAAV